MSLGMGDIPGVASVPPPARILASVNRQIDAAVATLPPGEWIAAGVDIGTDKGVNIAFIVRLDEAGHWKAVGYAAKRWGQPIEGGGAIRFSA